MLCSNSPFGAPFDRVAMGVEIMEMPRTLREYICCGICGLLFDEVVEVYAVEDQTIVRLLVGAGRELLSDRGQNLLSNSWKLVWDEEDQYHFLSLTDGLSGGEDEPNASVYACWPLIGI